jgi:hypothetical protein
MIFLLPVTGTVLFSGLTILYRSLKSSIPVRTIGFLKLTLGIVFFILVLFSYLTAVGKAQGLGSWFLPAAIILINVPNIYFIFKFFRRNKQARL